MASSSNLVVKASQAPIASTPAQAIAQPSGSANNAAAPAIEQVQEIPSQPAPTPTPIPNLVQDFKAANLDVAALSFDDKFEHEHSLCGMGKRFLSDTTMHGIPAVADEDWTLGHNFCARKFCWFAVWLLAMCGLVSKYDLTWAIVFRIPHFIVMQPSTFSNYELLELLNTSFVDRDVEYGFISLSCRCRLVLTPSRYMCSIYCLSHRFSIQSTK
jgi:hypothetical protein